MHSSTALIDYPNINALQNKLDALRVITKSSPPAIPCIDDAKLDEVFLWTFQMPLIVFPTIC